MSTRMMIAVSGTLLLGALVTVASTARFYYLAEGINATIDGTKSTICMSATSHSVYDADEYESTAFKSESAIVYKLRESKAWPKTACYQHVSNRWSCRCDTAAHERPFKALIFGPESLCARTPVSNRFIVGRDVAHISSSTYAVKKSCLTYLSSKSIICQELHDPGESIR